MNEYVYAENVWQKVDIYIYIYIFFLIKLKVDFYWKYQETL